MGANAGVIGVGQMGSGIARQLDQAGLLAAVGHLDADRARTLGLSRSVAALTPAEMSKACRFILFVVPGSNEIEEILCKDDGLLCSLEPETILIDLTTSDPGQTRRLAGLVAAAGGAYLDCGMTGGALAADAGKLTLMVGGETSPLNRARPILETIADRIIYLGASGAGHTMKLIHNLVCHSIFLATCEGAQLAEAAGIPLADAIEVFNAGNARSYASEVRFPKHIISGQFDGRSRIANLAKDMNMGVGLADRMDVPLSVSAAATSILNQAIENGQGDRDFTRLYGDLSRLIAASLNNETGSSV